MPVATAKKTIYKKFKIVRRSENTNDFGLRGLWIMAEDGETWECAVSYLHDKQIGEVIVLPYYDEPNFATPSWFAEIPTKQNYAPFKIIDHVWKEGWKGGFPK